MSIVEKKTKTVDQKKILLNAITVIIGQSLPELKTMLGEKKFEKRIKKVAKLLFKGLPESSNLPVVAKKAAKTLVGIKKPKLKLVAAKPKTIKRPATIKAVSNSISVIKKPLKKVAATKPKVSMAGSTPINEDTPQ